MQGVKQSSAAVAEHVATTIFGIAGSRADTSFGVSAGVPQWSTPGSMLSIPRVAIAWHPSGPDGGAPRCELEATPSSGADRALSVWASASHLRKQAVGTTCTATCRPTCTATCNPLMCEGGARCCTAGCMHVGARQCITSWQLYVWSDAEQLGGSQVGTGCVPGVCPPRRARWQLCGSKAGLPVGKPGLVRLRWPRLQLDGLQVRCSKVGPLAGHLASKLRGQLACDRHGLNGGRLRSGSAAQRVDRRQCIGAGSIAFLRVHFSPWPQGGAMSATLGRRAACNQVDAASSQMTGLHAGRKVAKSHGEPVGNLSLKLRSYAGGSAQCKLSHEVAGALVWLARGSMEGFQASRQVVRRSGLTTDSLASPAAGLSDYLWGSLASGLPGVLPVVPSRGPWLRLPAGSEGAMWDGLLGGLAVGLRGGLRTGLAKRSAYRHRAYHSSGPVRCKLLAPMACLLDCLSCGSKEGFRVSCQVVRRSGLMADSRVGTSAGLEVGCRASLLKRPAYRHRICTE